MPSPPTPDQIIEARKAHALSQQALACAMLGYTPEQVELVYDAHALLKQIREWESGRVTPNNQHTDRLYEVLEIER